MFILSGFISRTCITFGWEMKFVILDPHRNSKVSLVSFTTMYMQITISLHRKVHVLPVPYTVVTLLKHTI